MMVPIMVSGVSSSLSWLFGIITFIMVSGIMSLMLYGTDYSPHGMRYYLPRYGIWY